MNTQIFDGLEYFEGKRDIKALLIAHTDTVFDTFYGTSPKSNSVLEESGILRAVDENGNPQLFRADDRADISMLWLLKDSGHSFLITDGEENGRIGSK